MSSSSALKEKHDVIVTSHPSNIIVIFFTCVRSKDLFPDQQDHGHKSTQSYVVVRASVILFYPGLSVHDFKFEDCLKTLVVGCEVEDAKYGRDDSGYYNGGRGGNYNNGGGRGGGYNNGGRHGGNYCRYGCCGGGRYNRGCRCCSTLAEATAYKQAQTHN
ncbi:hypothetical protein Tco_0778622 [Tanacetum coccineum]